MMSSEIIIKSEQFVKAEFEKSEASKLTYHNWQHTETVRKAVELIASNTKGVGENEKEYLILGALFHDLGYLTEAEGHEKRSAEIASEFLSKEGYDKKGIQEVKEIILATELHHDPKNTLEEIIRDADLAHLGDEDYMNTTYKALAEEIKCCSEKKLSDKEWARKCVVFLSAHRYLTNFARKHFGVNKRKNIEKLKRQLQVLNANK